jgi:hypothetical protein
LIYDTLERRLVDTVVIHDSPFSMAWDGQYLWIGDKAGNVFAYNTDGSPTGFSFSLPMLGFSSLAFDGEYFLSTFILDANPIIYRLDETGTVAGTYRPWLENMNIWQMVFVPEHFGGKAWFTNNSGKIGRLRLDADYQAQMLEVYPAPATASYALAHDRTDLWYGRTGGTLYRIDDGIDELNWIDVQPGEGTVSASAVQNLSLTFDATRFPVGIYRANLGVLSNDPDQPEIRVPVALEVTLPGLGADTSLCGNPGLTLDAGAGFAGYLWSDGSVEPTLRVDSVAFGTGPVVIWVEVTDIGGMTIRDSISVNLLDCAGIFEFPSGLTVKVYPNPSQGSFTIETSGLNGRLGIKLTDMGGKVIFSGEMSSQATQVIDIESHPKGQYFLRMETGEGIRVERLIVN